MPELEEKPEIRVHWEYNPYKKDEEDKLFLVMLVTVFAIMFIMIVVHGFNEENRLDLDKKISKPVLKHYYSK